MNGLAKIVDQTGQFLTWPRIYISIKIAVLFIVFSVAMNVAWRVTPTRVQKSPELSMWQLVSDRMSAWSIRLFEDEVARIFFGPQSPTIAPYGSRPPAARMFSQVMWELFESRALTG